MRFSKVKQHIQKGIATLTIAVFLLAPLTPSFEVQKAEAFFGLGFGEDLLATKELTLDGIAFALAKQVVQSMTSSIVEWINSGFEGSPMFVTDLGGFLTDVADRVAGDFIQQLGLGVLCSPFQLNVRAALTIQYNKSKSGRDSQCTFSGVVENLENFGQGFTSWSDWFEITTRPQNNQYGALLLAQAELDVAIRNAQGEELQLLNWGEGFLSMKKCTDVAGGGQTCSVVTPGQIIEEQLTFHLSSGTQTLIEADEINEIIVALFAQLSKQAITGAGGLLGLSSGNTGSSSYLNQMDGGSDTVGLDYGNNDTSNPMQETIDSGNESLALVNEIIDLVDETEDSIPNDCSLELSDTLEDARALAEEDASAILAILSTLTSLSNRYAAAGPVEQDEIYLEFLEYQSSVDTRPGLDPVNLEIALAEVEDEVEDFEEEIDDECD